MGLSYKLDSVPATLNEGEFAVVNGTVYAGNADNEPVPVKGYREVYIRFAYFGSLAVLKEITEIPGATLTRDSEGVYELSFGGASPSGEWAWSISNTQSAGSVATYCVASESGAGGDKVLKIYKKLLSDNSISDSDTTRITLKVYSE